MDPENTDTGASEGASAQPGTAGAGSSDDGSAAGAGASADAGSSVDWQSRARQEQGRADRLQAELDRLNSTQSPPAQQTEQGEQPQYLTQADLVATLGRVEEMRALQSSLASEFPNADSSVFKNYLSYDSPEAFRAAAQRSHEAETAKVQAVREQVDAEWKERLGPLAEQFQTPAGGGNQPPVEGTLTLESYLALDLAGREKVYAENPDAVDRLLDRAGAA